MGPTRRRTGAAGTAAGPPCRRVGPVGPVSGASAGDAVAVAASPSAAAGSASPAAATSAAAAGTAATAEAVRGRRRRKRIVQARRRAERDEVLPHRDPRAEQRHGPPEVHAPRGRFPDFRLHEHRREREVPD